MESIDLEHQLTKLVIISFPSLKVVLVQFEICQYTNP